MPLSCPSAPSLREQHHAVPRTGVANCARLTRRVAPPCPAQVHIPLGTHAYYGRSPFRFDSRRYRWLPAATPVTKSEPVTSSHSPPEGRDPRPPPVRKRNRCAPSQAGDTRVRRSHHMTPSRGTGGWEKKRESPQALDPKCLLPGHPLVARLTAFLHSLPRTVQGR